LWICCKKAAAFRRDFDWQASVDPETKEILLGYSEEEKERRAYAERIRAIDLELSALDTKKARPAMRKALVIRGGRFVYVMKGRAAHDNETRIRKDGHRYRRIRPGVWVRVYESETRGCGWVIASR